MNRDAYSDTDAKKLKVTDLKVLYKWKYGKVPMGVMHKPDLYVDRTAVKNNPERERER